MAFKMKGSTFYGKPTGNGTSTDGSIKVDRKMDKSSKPDGRAKSSAFQKKGDKKDKRSDSEKNIQKKLDTRSSTYDYTPATDATVKTYRETSSAGDKDVNRTVKASADKTTRQTIHENKQKSHDSDTKWMEKSLKGAKKSRRKADRKAKKAAKAAKNKAASEQYYKDNPRAFRGH